MKGDISHVPNVFLVLPDCLCPGNDGVSDIAIVAPAYEGLPVIVLSMNSCLAADTFFHFDQESFEQS